MTSGGICRNVNLPALTALRALAALAVFVFHLHVWKVLHLPGAAAGYSGVGFFFVLSGFILTWTSWGSSASAGRFWWRRVARVWPAHLVVLVAAVAMPVAADRITVGSVVASGTLTQAWFPAERIAYGGNGVAWSLSCEVFFYALFPLLLPLLRRWSWRALLTVTVAAWVTASVVVVGVAAWDTAPGWTQVAAFTVPVLRLPEFMAGMVAARAVMEGYRLGWPLLAGAVVFLSAGTAAVSSKPALDVWAAPLFVAVIVVAARWDLEGRAPVPRWAEYAGEVSFVFYLVHTLAIVHTARFVHAPLAAAGVALAVATVGAVVVHHGVELPARRWLVALPGRLPTRTTRGTTGLSRAPR